MTDALNGVARYAYDADHRLTSVPYPDGNQTTYAYDADGDRTQVTDPLGRSSFESYDLAGNLSSATDAMGQRTSYSYDTLGRNTHNAQSRTAARRAWPTTRTATS